MKIAPIDQDYIAQCETRTKVRRERTPEEDAEWEADKRAEYEADRVCGHHWGNR
jgi:hypothetical protein